jgi:D-3-phosphoglycerate dehydrogenase
MKDLENPRLKGRFESMAQFQVVHTDPKLHPLNKELRDSLESAGASVVPLEGGPAEFATIAGETDAILNADFRLTADLIGALRRCRVISRLGTGVDNIDIPSATAKGILVANVPEFCTEEVANRAFTLLLACSCQLIRLDHSVREGLWRSPNIPDTVQIEGQTLGLLGFGKIARAVVPRARSFGMKVVAYDPYVSPSEMENAGASSCPFDTLLSISDFISINAPLTEATHHLVDRRALSLVKPTAIIINCARGGLIDEAALITALHDGRLAGAGLDVFEKEPPAHDNPLLKMEEVILTPHTAAHTAAALQRNRRIAVDNIVRVLKGQPLLNVVNPSVSQK